MESADLTTLLQELEGFDHIIWDWNGTLLNDAGAMRGASDSTPTCSRFL